MKERTYGMSVCVVCKKPFLKLSPVAEACGRACRQEFHLARLKVWRKENRKHVLDYMRGRVLIDRPLKRKRRARIQLLWGDNRRLWKEAEVDAARILSIEGFTEISWLNYSPRTPFDYAATKQGKRYAIQVTVRIHTDRKIRQLLARDLRLQYLVLFVSPSKHRYVLKEPHGYAPELSYREVGNSREYS